MVGSFWKRDDILRVMVIPFTRYLFCFQILIAFFLCYAGFIMICICSRKLHFLSKLIPSTVYLPWDMYRYACCVYIRYAVVNTETILLVNASNSMFPNVLYLTSIWIHRKLVCFTCLFIFADLYWARHWKSIPLLKSRWETPTRSKGIHNDTRGIQTFP